MPTYDYQCEKCGKKFEYFQSMKDEPLAICPEKACQQKTWGKGKVKRLIGSGAGIIFHGTGFYCTDFKNGTSAAPKSPAKSS